MNLSFKAPQPNPMETVLSLARAIVVGGPWALVPEEKWHAMHERHEADSEALRSALARVVEVETQLERMTKERATMVPIEVAKRDYDAMVRQCWDADDKADAARKDCARLAAELATARGQP